MRTGVVGVFSDLSLDKMLISLCTQSRPRPSWDPTFPTVSLELMY
jgi:hypothetical protein